MALEDWYDDGPIPITIGKGSAIRHIDDDDDDEEEEWDGEIDFPGEW